MGCGLGGLDNGSKQIPINVCKLFGIGQNKSGPIRDKYNKISTHFQINVYVLTFSLTGDLYVTTREPACLWTVQVRESTSKPVLKR